MEATQAEIRTGVGSAGIPGSQYLRSRYRNGYRHAKGEFKLHVPGLDAAWAQPHSSVWVLLKGEDFRQCLEDVVGYETKSSSRVEQCGWCRIERRTAGRVL
jgi:hypothetical protein